MEDLLTKFQEHPWVKQEVFGNSLLAYAMAGAFFVLIWFCLHGARAMIISRLARRNAATPLGGRGYFIDMFSRVNPLIFPLIAAFLASKRLTLNPTLDSVLLGLLKISVNLQITFLILHTVTFFVSQLNFGKDPHDPSVKNVRRNFGILLKMIIWAASFLFLLDNFGVNISTFITGLGIGGIAIALAAQAILGDTFSSFTIALDKPFIAGELISVGDLTGHVEYVGLKTTRIRSVTGELLIVSNSDLTGSRVKNFSRMKTQRNLVKLGVTYDTKLDVMREIPKIVEQAIVSTGKATFERAYFTQFGDSALIFDIAYTTEAPTLAENMAIQHEVNMLTLDAFNKRGIQFAFPTQTIHVVNAP